MTDSLIDTLARQAKHNSSSLAHNDDQTDDGAASAGRIGCGYPPYEGGLRLHVLASGSKGNCSVIEWNHHLLLIDAGISRRAIVERMTERKLDMNRVVGTLITHEHSDHIAGLNVLVKHHHMPVWTSETTARSKPVLNEVTSHYLKAFQPTEISGLRVIPFSTSHDACDPLGFRFEFDGDALAFATDTGELSDDNRALIADARILAIESNHDLRMLAQCDYPSYLKERIGSTVGHLSNKQAHGELVGGLITSRTQMVVGMHLSQQSNTPSIALNNLRLACEHMTHSIDTFVAFQECATSYW